MNADANIQATDEIIITSTSGNNTCSLGVTASGAEIINTNDGVTSSVRAT
jgi:archaeosine-15-forming tRNA-guanine transglycosylase